MRLSRIFNDAPRKIAVKKAPIRMFLGGQNLSGFALLALVNCGHGRGFIGGEIVAVQHGLQRVQVVSDEGLDFELHQAQAGAGGD